MFCLFFKGAYAPMKQTIKIYLNKNKPFLFTFSAHRRSTATPPHLSGNYQLQVYHIDGSRDPNLQQHQHQLQAQEFAAWSYGLANHQGRTPIYATSPRPPKDVTTTTYSGKTQILILTKYASAPTRWGNVQLKNKSICRLSPIFFIPNQKYFFSHPMQNMATFHRSQTSCRHFSVTVFSNPTTLTNDLKIDLQALT